MDLISKSLHYIGKNYKDAFVVQIGAMDGLNFDDTRGFLDMYAWPALLVEPIPAIFEELKNNFKDRNNYIYEQSAITEYDGEVSMLTVAPEIIEKENLHPGYKGMSAMYPLRNGFGSDYQRDIEVKAKYATNITVPCLTFESLLKKHNIEKFDVFICDVEGYDWNILKQIDLEKYRPKFIRIEINNLTPEEKNLAFSKLKQAGYVIDGVDKHDLDAVLPEIWEKIQAEEPTGPTVKVDNPLDTVKAQLKDLTSEQRSELLKYLTVPTLNVVNKDLTVVTGLWNINRPGRDFSQYIENFKRFLEIPVNMFIYIPQEYEYLVWEVRHKDNTYVKIYELSDVKNLYNPFWERTQKIRTTPEWFNQAGWLPDSPQAVLEWYNPIVQSKMFLLNDVTIWNPFDTEYFIWLDAGITSTVNSHLLINERALDKINPYLESFLFLSYPYQADKEIHGFTFEEINKYSGDKVDYVCRGGLFGGRKEIINQANSTYYGILDRTLSANLMGTEESIFTVMSYLEPERYRRYVLDDNGFIVKFIGALLNDTVTLEAVPERRLFLTPKNLDTSKLKTSLYMLTFNFPEQVRHTLETYKKHPGWLDKTRKILIDNSNNPEAIEGNKKVCEEYGFEHMITGENLGINRGRLFAAKHFQESDSDYYIFLEDDMGIHEPVSGLCRHGFTTYVPNLFEKIHKIMLKEEFDFLKISFTEVFMDNDIQCSWYNVPQHVRLEVWPHYHKLPVQGLDPNCPRTTFKEVGTIDELSYINGQVYYANWPMIVGKKGNYRMFLETEWANPYEQTWMSFMFQETVKGNLNPAVLLASPINHNRIAHYKPEERREN